MRRPKFGLMIGLFILLLATPACVSTPPTPSTPPTEPLITDLPAMPPPNPTATAEASPNPAPTLLPVAGPQPSYRVAAFYYPWYRTPDVDGHWDHWGDGYYRPPLNIPSDYYPALGVYSIADPAVLGQHFTWLREAGVGVIISSWWGQKSSEDQAVPLLLDIAERYGIKVGFHIEPYHKRTADHLVYDIRYLYKHYGDHPAFFRTTASSRWSPDDRPKGLFYLWSARFPDSDSAPVEADYWREAMDDIHALPDGGLVLADETVASWVDEGHFDGLYSYGVLDSDPSVGYSWARALPPDAWYVPGVNPGFSAVRIRYPEDTYTPRRDGDAYEERWEAALDVGVEPPLVTITTFNEWHEGTQIEPAAVGADDGLGYIFKDYNPLPPEGYLHLTRQWVDRFTAMTWPANYRIRIRLTTTSDWTTLALVNGGSWLRPSLVSASSEATNARMDGGMLILDQPLARAETGGKVEMVVDILLSGVGENERLEFAIERGHLGSTLVELFNYQGEEPVLIKAFKWEGIAPGPRNVCTFQVDSAALFAP